MLYFRIAYVGKFAKVIEVREDRGDGTVDPSEFIYRGDIKDFESAENIADQANALMDGNTYLAVDSGAHVHPRYDVVRAPKVGDFVSYGFNGDYYPDGTIVKVGGTNCSRVYTDTGNVYNRRRKTGSWIKRGGTWSMVRGYHKELNPSF